ncbi:hypothetical protein HDU96_000247 [Phlyctochytrium bullatum]|nr:hypothetical protein HDU96_000247 [Phlyctochytrium bullatum]
MSPLPLLRRDDTPSSKLTAFQTFIVLVLFGVLSYGFYYTYTMTREWLQSRREGRIRLGASTALESGALDALTAASRRRAAAASAAVGPGALRGGGAEDVQNLLGDLEGEEDDLIDADVEEPAARPVKL